MFSPSHFASVLLFALFASVVFGITQRETPQPHVSLRRLLLHPVCGIGDRAELGDVPDRALASHSLCFSNPRQNDWTRVKRTSSGSGVALPDRSVEHVNAVVAFGFVELDGAGIGFGDGEGDFADALAHEMGAGDGEQHARHSVAAEVGMNAELGDVAALRADARAEHQADEFAAGALDDHVRDLRGEDAAAGVAHDVVQKAQGAVDGAVLVVDEAVGMVRYRPRR